MTTDLARTIAAYATDPDLEVPEDALGQARRRSVDTVGVAVAGLPSAPATVARRHAATRHASDTDGATIWGDGTRSTPEDAALANGAAARYWDWNDAYFGRGGCHPSDVIPGLFGVAETEGRDGRSLLEAICVAYEVAIQLSDSFCVHEQGFDHVNVTALGAVAGAVRLLGLDTDQAAHAVALTLVPHTSLRVTRHGQLSMWKGVAAAESVRHAIYASLLARHGMHGPEHAFEGKMGFIEQLLHGKEPLPGPLGQLEQRVPTHRICDAHIKRWPLGYVAQSAVQAGLELYPEVGSIDDVDHIEIETYDAALWRMVSEEKLRPETRETADHSLAYVTYAALRDGRVDESTFEPARFNTPEVHRFLVEQMTIHATDRMNKLYPTRFPARVVVRLRAGSELERYVDAPMGHALAELSEDELERKFGEAAGPVIGTEATGPLYRAAADIASQSTLDDLAARLGQLALSRNSLRDR